MDPFRSAPTVFETEGDIRMGNRVVEDGAAFSGRSAMERVEATRSVRQTSRMQRRSRQTSEAT